MVAFEAILRLKLPMFYLELKVSRQQKQAELEGAEGTKELTEPAED